MGNALQDSTGAFSMAVTGTSVVWPIDGTFPFATATWALSTRTLTKTGAFTNYVWAAGDKVYISGPSAATSAGWIPGMYEIASANANAIVLSAPVADRAGESPRPLPPGNSTTAGYVLPNSVSGNRGATSTTAAYSILAGVRATIIDGILLKTVDASTAATITIYAHDGTTVIHTYAIAANASGIAYPIPLPLGVFGRRVLGGISAKSTVAGTTFEVFGRAVV